MVRSSGELGYAAALAGGTVLDGSVQLPPWLMGAGHYTSLPFFLWRFFDTKYLAYRCSVSFSALYAGRLLPFVVLATTLAMMALGELVFQYGADDLNTYFYYVISTAWAGILVMVSTSMKQTTPDGRLWDHRQRCS